MGRRGSGAGAMARRAPARSAALAAASLLVALGAVAPAAQARVIRAESVLPPGQSGFVAPAEVLQGTGSPHLTDQTELYERFEYKPAEFGQPGTTESPRDGVRITRDRFGVPAIDADSDYLGWWGVGYAVAQDRLFQLEAFRRATSGRLSEVVGAGSLDDDVIARRDYYTDDELRRQLDTLPAPIRARFRAYRDGINAWIAEVLAGGVADLPAEYVALLTPPPRWTTLDSARIGVFLARTVPSGDGAELANAAALQQLGPERFEQLLPLRSPGRLPTVPPSEGRFPSTPGMDRAEERAAFARSRRFVEELELPREPDANAGTLPQTSSRGQASALLSNPFDRRGSFMWAIGRPGGRSYLYNGPQLGFSIPELFVEYELHSPEQDVRGVSAAGVPVVGIGHNGRVAWGFTSGLTDDDDLYVERLTGPETYRYRGRERRMDCRDEEFLSREPVTSIPDLLTEPRAPLGLTRVRVCRTVHGPVQARIGNRAYARRFAIWGREVETIVGLTALNDADSIRDADRALAQVTWNENVIAADDRGHIGYWHPGLLPLRSERWDDRLPLPGTGEAEWRGFLKPEQRPHAIDPKRGWLANWNNVPSQGWNNGDTEARERLAGPLHRVVILNDYVRRAARDPSYQRSTSVVKHSGTVAQQFPYSRGIVRRAREQADGIAQRALSQLLEWRGNYARTNRAGRIAAGAAIWEELKENAAEIVLRRFGPGAELLDGGAGGSHGYDIRNAESYALRTLSPRRLAAAARRGANELRARFESSDPSDWRDPRLMVEVEAQGAGQARDIPFFDRGTWNQSVELGR